MSSTGLLLALGGALGERRRRRAERFDGVPAADRYADAHRDVALLSGLLAALPIIVAVA